MVRTHAVVAGDTLWQLALRFYGDAELYRLIAAASGISDPGAIGVGQRLVIPDVTRYTVAAGDTLSALALRFYGDAELYRLIAAVNGISDPAAVHAGRALVIFRGRSDGFGLTIVDRNEDDPRLWYYRFQTDAIGWNPGSTFCFPTTIAPADAPIPSSTCFTAEQPTSASSTSWVSET
ncbi:esterase [Mycobacteroides abscessus]|nr:esterase [Mycobacteroides abscessus]